MNNVLELKGKRFVQASKAAAGGGAAMNGNIIVTTDHIEKLIAQLQMIKSFWANEKRPFPGLLIGVHYNKIVAKSNRIAGLFKGADSNYCIVGAKFNKEKSKHIITYYITLSDLNKSIGLLVSAKQVLTEHFSSSMSKEIFVDRTIMDSIAYKEYGISKSSFKQVIADVSYIEFFEDYDRDILKSNKKQSIITLYDTGIDTQRLLKELGIDVLSSSILDNLTVFLDDNQVQALIEKAPYLTLFKTSSFIWQNIF